MGPEHFPYRVRDEDGNEAGFETLEAAIMFQAETGGTIEQADAAGDYGPVH